MADEDDHYRHAAEIVYVQNRQMHEYSLKMQADYGKWLVSSLLVLHGAAISGLLFKGSAGNPPPFLHAITWFVIGVVLALATGFSAWWNFTFAARQYHQWADFRMLTDKTYWPQSTQNGAVEATLWIAVVTGILSVVCLLGGAVAVLCTWR